MKKGIDCIGVTACFVLHDGQGSVLLHKRSQNCRDERGRWDIGGGAVEFGERVEDAVRREIYEELNVKPITINFLTALDVHRLHEGKPTHWVAMVFSVQIDPREVRINEPDKIEEVGWFTSNTLPSPMHSQFHKILPAAQGTGIIK